jgi:quinol monooxygenase YgiN
MTLRIFRVKVRQGRAAEFKRMVQEQSIPWLERSDGMLGYFAGEPHDDSSHEFVMVTLWRDVDALKEFAGNAWQTPVVTDDEAPLVEVMSADHYLRFDKAPSGLTSQ